MKRKYALKSDDTEVTYSFHGPNDEGLTENTYEGIANTVKISEFPHAPPRYGKLLTALTDQYQPSNALELGTCLGTSAAYIGAGLRNGHLTTVEAGEPQVEIARETIAELDMEEKITVRHGLFQDLLLRDTGLPEFDLAFLDGHHQKDAVLEYFDGLYDIAKDNSAVVFDDVNGYSEGMDEAWEAICEDPRVGISVRTNNYGFVLIKSDVTNLSHFSLPY